MSAHQKNSDSEDSDNTVVNVGKIPNKKNHDDHRADPKSANPVGQNLNEIFNTRPSEYNSSNLPAFESRSKPSIGNFLSVRMLINQQIDMQQFGKILEHLQTVQMQPFNLKEKLGQIPDNYSTWHKLMQSKFRILGLNVFLVNTFDEDVLETDQYQAVTEVIRDYLISNVHTPAYLNTVLNAKTGVDAWFQLESECMGNSYVRGTAVIHKLHKLYEKKSTDVAFIVNEFKSIMEELSKLFKIDAEEGEVLWINYLLTLLPPNFMFVSSIIRNEKYNRLSEVYQHILDEYQVYQQGASANLVNGVKTNKSTSRPIKKKLPRKEESKGDSLKCSYCGKEGHENDTCFKKLREKNEEKKKAKNGGTNAISIQQPEGTGPSMTAPSGDLNVDEIDAMMADVFICNLSPKESIDDPKNYNILDGGCSAHSCSTLSGCIAISPITGLASDVANGNAEPVVGIGTYLFKTPSGYGPAPRKRSLYARSAEQLHFARSAQTFRLQICGNRRRF